MHEEILEVIETLGGKALYITPSSIIIAKLRSAAFMGTFTVLNTMFGLLTSLFEKEMIDKKIEKLGKLCPEKILNANEKNFAIPYTEVIRLEMSKGFLRPRVKITVGVNKHRFWLRKHNDFYKCMSALKPILGDTLTVS